MPSSSARPVIADGLVVEAVRPGKGARERLQRSIVDLQAGHPLSPVTVVVPHAGAAGPLRESLATTGPGVAGLRVTTLAGLASDLSDAPPERPTLTPGVERELIRLVLARHEGPLGTVAHAAATHPAVQRTFRRLRVAESAAPETLGRLTADPGTADLMEAYAAFRVLATAYVDDVDRAQAGVQALAAGTADLSTVGPIVLYLPLRLTPSGSRLVTALAERTTVRVLVGWTGDAVADDLTRRWASTELGCHVDGPDLEEPAPTTIVTAPDASEESRAATRRVVELIEEGAEPGRIGLFHAAADPYATVLRDTLVHAGIPARTDAAGALRRTSVARTLIGLLRWREEDHRRDALLDWLHVVPATHDGDAVPTRLWAHVSAEANVVRSREQWDTRLAALARRAEVEAANGSDRAEHAQRLAAVASDLRAYTLDLAARLDGPDEHTWSAWVDWALDLVAHTTIAGPDPAEAEAIAHVDVLRGLDGVHERAGQRSDVDHDSFLRALVAELDDAVPTAPGRDGVHVGSIADALGVELDHVIIVGAVEGAFPAPGADDPLLPDLAVRASGDETARPGLRTRAERERDGHRTLAAVLAGADERTVSWSRVDRRRQRGQVPAPWVLSHAGRLAGEPRPLRLDELDASTADWHVDLVSHERALADAPVALDVADRRLAIALAHEGDELPAALVVDPRVRRGIAVERDRASTRFGPNDGHVGAHPHLDEILARPMSPTGLESYASCPRQFLFRRVLRISSIEEPREPLTASPRDRGSIVHDVLERYVGDPGTAALPSDQRKERMRALADIALSEASARWPIGRELLWEHERADLLRQLDTVVDVEEVLRRDGALSHVESEVSVGDGPGDPEAVTVSLPSGRSLAFKGRMDRLDRDGDGTERVIASDYKTSRRSYRSIAEDPVGRGTTLQGAIYALMAQARHPEASVRAQYWSVNEHAHPGNATAGFELAEQRPTILAALDLIAEGVSSGVFPSTPGEWNDFFGRYDACAYCPYDRICAAPGERERGWERDRQADEVGPVVALREGDYLPLVDAGGER